MNELYTHFSLTVVCIQIQITILHIPQMHVDKFRKKNTQWQVKAFRGSLKNH